VPGLRPHRTPVGRQTTVADWPGKPIPPILGSLDWGDGKVALVLAILTGVSVGYLAVSRVDVWR